MIRVIANQRINNEQKRRLSFNSTIRSQGYGKENFESQFRPNKYCLNHPKKEASFAWNSQKYCELCAIKLASKGQPIEPIPKSQAKRNIQPKDNHKCQETHQNVQSFSNISDYHQREMHSNQSLTISQAELVKKNSSESNSIRARQTFKVVQQAVRKQMDIYNKVIQNFIEKLRDQQIKNLMQFNQVLQDNKRQFQKGLHRFYEISHIDFLNLATLSQIFKEVQKLASEKVNDQGCNHQRHSFSTLNQRILEKSQSSMKTKANTIKTNNNNFSQNGVSQNSIVSVNSKGSGTGLGSSHEEVQNQRQKFESLIRQKRSVVLRKQRSSNMENTNVLSISTKIPGASYKSDMELDVDRSQKQIETCTKTKREGKCFVQREKDGALQDTPQSLKSQISATQTRIKALKNVQMFDKIDICESIDNFDSPNLSFAKTPTQTQTQTQGRRISFSGLAKDK